jgi:hypothetical protein
MVIRKTRIVKGMAGAKSLSHCLPDSPGGPDSAEPVSKVPFFLRKFAYFVWVLETFSVRRMSFFIRILSFL